VNGHGAFEGAGIFFAVIPVFDLPAEAGTAKKMPAPSLQKKLLVKPNPGAEIKLRHKPIHFQHLYCLSSLALRLCPFYNCSF